MTKPAGADPADHYIPFVPTYGGINTSGDDPRAPDIEPLFHN